MAYKKIRICRITFFYMSLYLQGYPVWKFIKYRTRKCRSIFCIYLHATCLQSLEFVKVGIGSDEYIRKWKIETELNYYNWIVVFSWYTVTYKSPGISYKMIFIKINEK